MTSVQRNVRRDRSSLPARRATGVAIAIVLTLGSWAAEARAASTTVYWDILGNVAPMPNPFPSLPVIGGEGNTASGFQAMQGLTTGRNNTGTGECALQGVTTGVENAAFGGCALALVSDGSDNTAVGESALGENQASRETAVGANALFSNSTGTGTATSRSVPTRSTTPRRAATTQPSASAR
jgi:hypothetical protein